MRLQDALLQCAEPRVHLVVGESGLFAGLVKEIENRAALNRGIVRQIDGLSANNKERLLGSFAAAFEFPDYFSRNWDAFDECINDLKWLPADYYVTCLKRADKLLAGNNKDFQTLIDILALAGRDWAAEDRGGDPLAGRPRPFHIILHTEADSWATTLKRAMPINSAIFDTTRL